MHARIQGLFLGLAVGLWMVAAGCTPPQQPPVVIPEDTFQSATEAEGGESVTVRMRAEDPNGGALSFSWETQDGTLSAPVTTRNTSEVLWKAPPCARVESVPTLTATITNSQGLSTAHDFKLNGVPLCLPSRWEAMSVGHLYTLALDDKGRVWAWGDNGSGQLGDGTTTRRQTPIVTKDLRDVVAVAAGDSHSLALKSDGTVWAWGSRGYGQLGDGENSIHPRTTPVQVSGLGGVVAISVKGNTSLALKSDGTVWAWGTNWEGQLGNGTLVYYRATPGQVVGLDGVVSIAASGGHSLAVKSDGTLWGWGSNFLGMLDGGTPGTHRTPVRLHGFEQVVSVSTGSHSLVLKSDGTVWAWGENMKGELGDGTTDAQKTPVQVVGLGGVAAVATRKGSSLALKSDGTVWVWGNDSLRPTPVSGLEDVVAIATGTHHTLALKPDGTLWGWGSHSMLATGMKTYHPTPVPTSQLGEVKAMAVGAVHSAALKPDGTVWAWGSNTSGQLGDGTATARATPGQVAGLNGGVGLAAGLEHTVVAKDDGTVWSWGDNVYGQLGDGTRLRQRTPVQVTGVSGGVAVAAGKHHSLALKSDGTVWAWGANDLGQLGDGIVPESGRPLPEPRPMPGPVVGLEGVVAVAAGMHHSLALKSDGTVWSWGYNELGQLGDGTIKNHVAPVQVVGLSAVVAVAAGVHHSLALKSDGTVWAWGANTFGQLGDGRARNQELPVQVFGLTGAVAIGAGDYSSMAVKSDGSLWVWGSNDAGQLGGAVTGSSTPLPKRMPGFSDGAAVCGARTHSLVRKTDGTLWGWGGSGSGQLGNGSIGVTSTPVQVGVRIGSTGG
jgi:alpha-tubulin suppressor-like RCC1 family protein